MPESLAKWGSIWVRALPKDWQESCLQQTWKGITPEHSPPPRPAGSTAKCKANNDHLVVGWVLSAGRSIAGKFSGNG